MKLYPYQIKWLKDKSRRKLASKSRRIGFSFAEGLDSVLSCHERQNHKSIILSRSERLSKEFISESVVPHVKAIGIVADCIEGTLPGTSQLKNEVVFGNGARCIALPANPDTARSYEGDITLDEFGFHKQARKIAEAIIPSITRGFRLKIISTPNGQQGPYYELSKECGLVDGIVTGTRFSPHRVDIHQAIAQGCLDKDGHVLDADEIRASCLDEEMWLQEYCCQFLSTLQQWISPELFQANVHDDAVTGYPNPELRHLYAGWDVARHKDLSVVWLLELLGDVTWTRGVVEFKNVPTPKQSEEARALMLLCNRMCVDSSGMGLAIYESLDEKFAGRVEGITFTLQSKEIMAVHAKRRMEAHCARLPDTDMVRNSFRSVQRKLTATGQSRFDAEHDAKYGHADHWWAYCLAEHAAGAPVTLGVVDYLKNAESEEMARMQRITTNAKTEMCPHCSSTTLVIVDGVKVCRDCKQDFGCPECGSKLIVRVAGQQRCNACGHQWGKVSSVSIEPGQRRTLLK